MLPDVKNNRDVVSVDKPPTTKLPVVETIEAPLSKVRVPPRILVLPE